VFGDLTDAAAPFRPRTGLERPKEEPESRKPTSLEVGFARTLYYQGFRLGESFSTVNNRQKL
jgi:hypothetical protein